MSKKNVDDLGWLAVGRHVGAKMIYITQLSSVADINITRWANIVISKGYSTSAAGASNIERKHIADNPVLRYLKPRKNYARIESDERDWSVVSMGGTDFMVHLKPPAFMNDKLSRPYQRYIERAEGDQKAAEKLAMQDAEVMKREEIPAAVIYQQMMIRGFYKSLAFWQDFTGESKKRGYDDYS